VSRACVVALSFRLAAYPEDRSDQLGQDRVCVSIGPTVHLLNCNVSRATRGERGRCR
jgi:hypothetical protein